MSLNRSVDFWFNFGAKRTPDTQSAYTIATYTLDIQTEFHSQSDMTTFSQCQLIFHLNLIGSYSHANYNNNEVGRADGFIHI